MSVPYSVLIVTNEDFFATEAIQHFRKVLPSYIQFTRCNFHEVLSQRKQAPPTVVLVDLGEVKDFVFSLVKRIANHFENSRLVGAGYPADVSLLLDFVKMGVKDFLKFPFEDDEIKRLAEEIRLEPAHSTNVKKYQQGQIVTIYSPKGGSGVTLLTANLAVAIAKKSGESKNAVCVCDFAFQCGDVAAYLNLTPVHTFRDLVCDNPELDMSFLDGVLLKDGTGVRILPAPSGEDELPAEDQILTTVEATLALLKQQYNNILIDASHLRRATLDFVLCQSDQILLVGNPDVASLKGLVASYKKLRLIPIEAEKIKVIINRFNSKSHIDTREFEKKTDHAVAIRLPNNYLMCIEAVNAGRPLSDIQEKSDLAKKIAELAQTIMRNGREVPEETPKKVKKDGLGAFSFLQRIGK